MNIGPVTPGNGGGWTTLLPSDILTTNDPNSMIASGPTVDASGEWTIELTQTTLGTRHEGRGCVVMEFDLPQLGTDSLKEHFYSRICAQRPTSGGWGVGLGIGSYTASQVYTQQLQYVPTAPKWRRAEVVWANLAVGTRVVPDSATAEILGPVIYSKGSALAFYTYGFVSSGASGIVQGQSYESNVSIAAPKMQLTLSASESGAQTGVLKFTPKYFRVDES